MSNLPVPSKKLTEALPTTATWDKMSTRVEIAVDETLSQWMDDRLDKLEHQLQDYVTANSLKQSLCSER